MVDSERSEQDALALRARSEDPAAMADLFHQFRPRLRRVVDVHMDQRMRGRLDPSDVLQEAYLDLASRLPAFAKQENGMSVFVWMRLVVKEKLIQLHRRHVKAQKRSTKREVSIDAPALANSSICLAGHLLDHFSSAGNKLIREELRRVLISTLDAMRELDREVILMRAFEELSNVETAEALGISQNSASIRYARAMTRLKKNLEDIPGFSL